MRALTTHCAWLLRETEDALGLARLALELGAHSEEEIGEAGVGSSGGGQGCGQGQEQGQMGELALLVLRLAPDVSARWTCGSAQSFFFLRLLVAAASVALADADADTVTDTDTDALLSGALSAALLHATAEQHTPALTQTLLLVRGCLARDGPLLGACVRLLAPCSRRALLEYAASLYSPAPGPAQCALVDDSFACCFLAQHAATCALVLASQLKHWRAGEEGRDKEEWGAALAQMLDARGADALLDLLGQDDELLMCFALALLEAEQRLELLPAAVSAALVTVARVLRSLSAAVVLAGVVRLLCRDEGVLLELLAQPETCALAYLLRLSRRLSRPLHVPRPRPAGCASEGSAGGGEQRGLAVVWEGTVGAAAEELATGEFAGEFACGGVGRGGAGAAEVGAFLARLADRTERAAALGLLPFDPALLLRRLRCADVREGD